MESTGEFLRKMRARQQPDEGAAQGRRRRRTPGLRREEVAERAGVSVDWYVRLEQDRAERPSAAVLDAVARALSLSQPERNYLFRVARAETPVPPPAGDAIHPSLAVALGALADRPALILGPRFEVLCTNPLAESLFGGFSGKGIYGRNAAVFTLADPRAESLFVDYRKVARETVGTVRSAFVRRPFDAGFLGLLAELSSRSRLFVALWAEQYVAEKGVTRKRFAHATAGALDFETHPLAPPDAEGQLLTIFEPASAATRARLPLLLSGRSTGARPGSVGTRRSRSPGTRSGSSSSAR